MKVKQIFSSLMICSSSLLGCTQTSSYHLPQVIHLNSEILPSPIAVPISHQPGGKISLKFNYKPTKSMSFKTQAACTVSTDVLYFRVYLIDGSTGGLGPLGNTTPFISLGPLDGKIKAGPFDVNNTISSSGGSQTITLSNVDTGEYYLAVAAYDGTGNITTSLSIVSSLGGIGAEPVVLSDGGGNTTNPGRVEIGSAGADFPIINSTEATLTMTLELDSLKC